MNLDSAPNTILVTAGLQSILGLQTLFSIIAFKLIYKHSLLNTTVSQEINNKSEVENTISSTVVM